MRRKFKSIGTIVRIEFKSGIGEKSEI